MKFGQLTEYNIRNIFLEKSYTKSGGETISGPFYKKLMDQWSRVLYSLFYIVCLVVGYRNLLKLSCRLPAFALCKVF